MIIGRLTKDECPCDFLRLVYNRGLIYSINIFVIGKGQTGKSTFVHFCCNKLRQLALKIPLKKATWREWDYEKFTSTTPQEFVSLWDQNESEDLSLEEAGEQINIYDWLGIMNKVFASTTSTQGLKLNRCWIITPYFDDITKHAKGRMDFVVILHHRDDVSKTVQASPFYVRLNWKTFKPEFKPLKKMIIQYNAKSLKEARNYTNYLKQYKRNISEKNKELVGLKQSDYERFCDECLAVGVKPPSISYAKRNRLI